MKKKFNPRIKARLRKNRQVLSKNIDNFFAWVKGAKLVELKECNPDEDPVRPCLLYTSPSPRDIPLSRMPSSA